VDALVVVVNGDGEFLFGLVLADYIFIEESFDLLRLGQVIGCGGGVSFRAVIFQNGIANGNALIADVSSRVIVGRGDEFGNGVLRLMAERAS